MPQSALAVVKLNNVSSFRLEDPTLLSLTQSVPLREVLFAFDLDTLVGLESNVAKVLAKEVLVSLHPSKGKLQGLHVVNLGRDYALDWVDTLAVKLGDLQTRIYDDLVVREIISSTRKLLYSYFIYKDCLVGSVNPVLVDDAIRKINRISYGNYFYTLNKRMQYHKLSSQIELYFDGERLLSLLRELVPDFPILLRSGKFSAHFAPGRMSFEGVFAPKFSRSSDVLDLLQKQEEQQIKIPKELSVAAIVPVQSGSYKVLSALAEQGNLDLPRSHIRQPFLKGLSGNVSLFVFKEKVGTSSAKLAILESSQPLKLLQMISQEEAEDSVLVSAQSELLAELFGLYGFEKGFAMANKKRLLYANSPKVITDFLLLEKRRGSFDTLLIKGAYLKVNTLSVWEDFVAITNPHYQHFVDKQKKIWSKFLDIEARFFYQDKHPKAEIDIFWKKNAKQIYPASDTLQRFTVFKNLIQAGPWPCTNPLSGMEEVLVLEAGSGFYLLNHQGKVISTHPVQNAEPQTLQQIDLYGNGKTQFLVLAGGMVRCFDRMGKSITDFPLKAQEPLSHVSIFDFMGKHNYMLAGLTQDGALYGLSKYATPFKEWQPIQLGTTPIGKVAGLVFGKESFVITLTQNGMARVFDEFAEIRKGFPLNFKVQVAGRFAVLPGATPSTTRVRFVTYRGELIDFDLVGGVTGRQILAGISDAGFEMVFEALRGQKFIICAQNENQFALFNSSGELIFTKEFYSPKSKKFQYHDLGRNTEVVAVWDSHTKNAMVYDLAGNPLLSQSLTTNDCYFAFVYEETTDSYKVIYSYNNKLLFTRFDR